MNKEYICSNDKVEVKDEYGKIRVTNYCDNIEKILIKENIIEQIDVEIKKLLNEKKHNKNISYKLLKKCLITLLLIPTILIILPLIFGITSLSSLPIFGSVLTIIIPAYLGLFLIYDYNKTNKVNKMIEVKLKYLENRKTNKIKNLQKLNKKKTSHNKVINVPVSKRVDDTQELKKLRKDLLFYSSRNFYKEKHLEYSNQNSLNNVYEESIVFSKEELENNYKINILKRL